MKVAKVLASESGCELKRIRRSRNWQVTGNIESIQKWISKMKTEHFDTCQFLITKVDDGLRQVKVSDEPTEAQLITLIQTTPNMTLFELMEQTSCTLAQARKARFIAEC
ncbi:ribosome recycling factor family protein [Vibrio sp. TRT 17S01]|uniref:ribosome recycling factor family protein n=1 Tax=Vibrio sp. TRT 17S01 TaxID=3418505 RepID=UPI003CEC1574